ncbi:MAG: magnesium transporter [Chitinispirillaceae bacterium]
MLKELLTPEIIQLVRERKWADLRQALIIWPPAEVADLIQSLESPERVLLLRFLPRRFSAEVFSELSPLLQDELLKDLTNQEIRRLLADLSPDDRTALMEELPAEVSRKLIGLLSPEDLKETQQLLGYPDGSVGRVMTPNFVDIRAEWKVKQALEHIRKMGRDSETINVVYVVDAEGKLLDDIQLRHLILASPETPVESVMDRSFVSISAYSDQEEAVSMIKKYNYLALPVVDSIGVLLGIVTIDDLMDVADVEVTEDFHRLGGVSVETHGEGPIESLRDATVSLLFRRRIVWLVLLVFVNILSGAGIALFENIISSAVALVFFLPLLIASGGNAGAQAATLMVRALATGDVKMNDWWRMLGKEMLVSTTLGLTMGVAVSLVGFFRAGLQIGVIVATSMFLIVVTGSLVGLLLPFILRKVGKDPATASAPLVTSIADVSGVVIYFSIATQVLS